MDNITPQPERKTKILRITQCAITVGSLMLASFYAGWTNFGVQANGWNGLVYSVNGNSSDATGNVTVSNVSNHTVGSDIPSSTNFTQYSSNTSELTGVTNLVGEGTLDTDADDIIGAINELNEKIDGIAIGGIRSEVILDVPDGAVAGQTYNLSSPITDYDYLLIEWKTNYERTTSLHKVTDVEISNEFKTRQTAIGASAYGQTSSWQYMTNGDVLFPTTQTAKFYTTYTNVNYTIKPYKIYGIKAVSPSGGSIEDASDVLYDNTSSGMTADNVQDAIDELKTEIDDLTMAEETVVLFNMNNGIPTTTTAYSLAQNVDKFDFITISIAWNNTDYQTAYMTIPASEWAMNNSELLVMYTNNSSSSEFNPYNSYYAISNRTNSGFSVRASRSEVGIKIVGTRVRKAEKNVYSTDETVVGTWIDGKPIYRKVWTGLSLPLVANTDKDSGINIANLENVIGGKVMRSSSPYQTLLVHISISTSNGNLLLNCPNFNSTINTLVVEYTKTTD